jgi:hypothetical protein
MPKIFFLAVLLCACRISFCADNAPANMTHLTVTMTGTDIPADSFAAKPKTMWRAGTGYCRTDEEPDAANGIHGRIITNEPDSWMINLADHTAKHIPDSGPTYNCRMPVFAYDLASLKSKLGELEFGREVDFFEKNGAAEVKGPEIKSFKSKAFVLTVGDVRLLLIENMDLHAPVAMAMYRGDNTTRVKYLFWEVVPFDAALFDKPSGVKIEEVK